MGASQRRKGAAAEREVGAILGLARNARNGLEAGDLFAPPSCPFSFEVKRRGRAFGTVYAALDQAKGYSMAKTPVALIRDDRQEWLAVMRLEDLKPYLTDWTGGGFQRCCGDCGKANATDGPGCASAAVGKPTSAEATGTDGPVEP